MNRAFCKQADPEQRIGEPLIEPGWHDASCGARSERAVVDFDPETERDRVGHHSPRVAPIGKQGADELGERRPLRPGNFDHAIDRIAERNVEKRSRDILDAIGCIAPDESRTTPSFVPEPAIPHMNSKKWVARTAS